MLRWCCILYLLKTVISGLAFPFFPSNKYTKKARIFKDTYMVYYYSASQVGIEGIAPRVGRMDCHPNPLCPHVGRAEGARGRFWTGIGGISAQRQTKSDRLPSTRFSHRGPEVEYRTLLPGSLHRREESRSDADGRRVWLQGHHLDSGKVRAACVWQTPGGVVRTSLPLRCGDRKAAGSIPPLWTPPPPPAESERTH